MKLLYTNDICNNEILQDETGNHQIMMEWEKPYMEKCIELLEPSGSILEIGYGMGYSAHKLCSYNDVKCYTVIECSPIVWRKFDEFKNKMSNIRPELEINIIKGRWEDILTESNQYDSVFFDDYNGSITSESINRFNKFLYEIIINKHINIGSKVGHYSTGKTNIDIECLSTKTEEFYIKIPEYCKYAKGDKMYIPIIELIKEPTPDLKLKLINDNPEVNKKFIEQVEKYKIYKENSNRIYCNLLIIDNFYTNAMETRNYILTQDFKVRGNYPGQRTESRANVYLKNMIEGYISHFAGKITCWPTEKDSYNGAFQYTTSRDRTWIHNDGWNNWAGVLYLTPNAPVTSGTGIYRFHDGTRNVEEAEARGNKKIIDDNSQDYTKWELVDRVGNVFNRLVLFNSKQYHASQDYFGTNKENGRLFQVFFFSTER